MKIKPYQVIISTLFVGTILFGSPLHTGLAIDSYNDPLPAGSQPIFVDVPYSYWAWEWIEILYGNGVTNGCSTNPAMYCPEDAVTRAQMAVFLERGVQGSTYQPPAVGSSTGFNDVPTTYWAAAWIKQLAVDGITTGCGGGNYCPEDPVTRAQMSIFLLRAKHGAGYTPPAVGGSTGFNDVSIQYWAAAWIMQLAAESITSGCGNGNYCPEDPVTRAQMAVFLVKTFNLPIIVRGVTKLPGPPGIAPFIDVAIDPTNDQNIYLSNFGHVFISHDGGLSWKDIPMKEYFPLNVEGITDIEISNSNPSIVYITGHSCVGKSIDAGLTWNITVLDNESDFIDIAIDPKNELNVYLVSIEGKFYKTEDGGLTWKSNLIEQNIDNIYMILLNRVNPNRVFIATDHGVFQSNDQGESWSLISTAIGNDPILSLAGYFDEQTTIIYAESMSNGIYKTSNEGISWLKIYSSGHGSTTEANFHWESISIDVFDPNIVLFNFWMNGVYKSTDGGANWNIKNRGLYNLWITRLEISKQNPNIFIVTTYGAGSVFKSVDGGNNWFEISEGLNDQRVDSVAIGKYLYASAGAAGIYYSADQGQSWSLGKGMEFADEIMKIRIDPRDNNIIYSIDFSGEAYKSVDAGVSWDLIFQSNNLGRDIAISPADSQVLFIANGNGGIFKSENGGISWISQNNGLSGHPMSGITIDPSDPNNILSVSSRDFFGAIGDEDYIYRIFRSINNGSTWEQVYQIKSERIAYWPIIWFDPDNPENVLAVIDGSNLLISSSDHGKNWKEVGYFNGPVPSRGFPYIFDPEVYNMFDIYFGPSEVVKDPNDPNVYYAGFERGGFYKITGYEPLDLPSPLPPLPPSSLPIVIDGYNTDWQDYPIITDTEGDSIRNDTDITGYSYAQDANYLDILIETKDPITHNPATFDINLLFNGSYEFEMNVNSDGSVWAGTPPTRYPSILVAWQDVVEIQIPKSIFEGNEFIEVDYISLFTDVNGTWTFVDGIP